MTIIFTVFAQGLTAKTAAKLCDCLVKDGYILVIGANVLGRIISKVFVDMGKEVYIIDNNIDHCKLAEEEGLKTIHGNCLDTTVLEKAKIDKVSILISTTSNSQVNFLVSSIAKESYQIPYVYPAIGSPDKNISHGLVEEIGGDLAYAKIVSIPDWKKAIDNNQIEIFEKTLETNGKLSNLKIDEHKDEDWLPIILKRKDSFFFAHSSQIYNKGDLLISLSKSSN